MDEESSSDPRCRASYPLKGSQVRAGCVDCWRIGGSESEE